ncbi:MAG: DNA repair protein RecN [Bacteroidales bacterium]|jgi:DNA repair protein RecN (Recombination protein N)|nr:DNA repair protein RecN [Bacteroidales bacterium]
MLTHLYIENYALIHSLDISFNKGFTAITGETGAGKSIMLGALGLVLGAKADTRVLFDTNRKCIVEAQFILQNRQIEERLKQYDIDILQNFSLILRREILPEGRSRSFVNDTPVSVATLKDIAGDIIDIHSQHETLTLGNASFQMDLLDSFCAETNIAGETGMANSALIAYQSCYKKYGQTKKEFEKLSELDNRLKEEHDYIKFLYEELTVLNLHSEEQEELEEQLKELENANTIKETLLNAENILSGGDNGDSGNSHVINQLSVLIQTLKKSAQFHNGIAQVLSRIESSLIEFKDIANEISRISARTVENPVSLENIKGRLDEIYRLENKHRVNSITELLALGTQWQQQLEKTHNIDEQLRNLKEQLDEIEVELRSTADKLHVLRKNSSEKLSQSILIALAQVGMERAQLRIDVNKQNAFLKNGMDTVQFLFNANLGGVLQPLDKVASGGEMSRLMLAIKSVINQTSVISTIIFDEIDTGVSGNIASKVALMMKEMSHYMQVIAVTHLHQIAAKADSHLKVTKDEKNGRTLSVMKQLDSEEHINEIAAMMSSGKITDASLAAAIELCNE